MPSLTVSGNEVTDASRALALTLPVTAKGQMIDGRQADSSFGIRRAATNGFRHGQCDTSADYNLLGSGTAKAIDASSPPPFSTQSVKITTGGTAANDGVELISGTGLGVGAGTPVVGSAWVALVAGASYYTQMRTYHTDATNATGTQTPFTAQSGRWLTYTDPDTGQVWELVTAAAFNVPAGKTCQSYAIHVRTSTARVESFHVAHAMLETGQTVVAPYVATSGGVTATHAAGRVQAPASLLDKTQGWIAARVRMGFPSATPPTGVNANIFAWWDDAANRLGLIWNGGTKRWEGRSLAAGSGINPVVADAFNAGDLRTVILAWDATLMYLSVNGAAFVAGTAARGVPALAAALFDIGSSGTLFSNPFDGDVLAFACGTGPLTDADAATLNALGDATPTMTTLGPAAQTTMVWDGETVFYGPVAATPASISASAAPPVPAIVVAAAAIVASAAAPPALRLQLLLAAAAAMAVESGGIPTPAILVAAGPAVAALYAYAFGAFAATIGASLDATVGDPSDAGWHATAPTGTWRTGKVTTWSSA